jgi:uncharacterized coiled-coil DUF342 family protein
MDIQEYNELLYKLRKYYKLNNKYNKDKYQRKIKKIGKQLGEHNIIQFGGVLSHQQIKDLLKDFPRNISEKLNLELNLEVYNNSVDVLIKNHENIIILIEDYKNAIIKLIAEKEECFAKLQEAKAKPDIKPEEISVLQTKLTEYETKINEKITTLKSLIRKKDESNVDKVTKELSEYLSDTKTDITSASSNLLSPVKDLIVKIDKYLGK